MASQRPDTLLSSNSFSSQPKSGTSTAATSPTEQPLPSSSHRLQLSSTLSSAPATGHTGIRTASPNHDFNGRLFPKRAREIQAQEGLSPQIWGPPTSSSGHSTRLRETIPESPTGESFPDLQSDSSTGAQNPVRGRARAGTLPSRLGFTSATSIGGIGTTAAPPSLLSKTARPTPSTSPMNLAPPNANDTYTGGVTNSQAALLQRLRAGSVPQRPNLGSNPFGSSLFSSAWANRDRSNTLASIRSNDGPSSPAQSSFSRDGLADTDVKTLDYLGLVDTPKPSFSSLAGPDISNLINQQSLGLPAQTLGDLTAFSPNANRFRSYSVNATEKYADEEEDMMGPYSGSMTPSEANAAAYNLQEMVRLHNMEVRAFTNTITRPRASTAGVLDSPSNRLRNYLPAHSRLDNSLTASELAEELDELKLLDQKIPNAHLKMQLLGANNFFNRSGDDNDTPTRALWLGNIPSSTTVSSLTVIFSPFGGIESARVLTHKNCGFVNFESLESAVNARSHLNGKEIFPGAGPIRIGYAKAPSGTSTPVGTGVMPSSSPDILPTTDAPPMVPVVSAPTSTVEETPSKTLDLVEVKTEVLSIVKELGATEEDLQRITAQIDVAIQHNHYESEIPAVPEPNHNRIHDAPKLRDIRKRIDNNTCSPQELEDTALNMLDEIAELSSDYLGNTVVQKLFEYCSESTKEVMLKQIAPYLAEIGVHKNGTWAAQKIIDVARSPALMSLVVESLRTYAMPLFLDQFGNYVMQGCLRYQHPLNNFIFEVMLCRLWELAQGRFGARAMRACLESHHATKDQQRMVAATIAMHSVQLATNTNGALLLTWFLDTCTFPRRRTVLAPRLVPHLVRLCTHKVAYLTVLKIINQRNEPEARDTILQALFFSTNDQVLEQILSDQQCGATLIFKVLTTPFFDEKIRSDVVQNIRTVLVRIKAQPQQGYKRLMDEVGLSTRSSGARDGSGRADERPSSKHSNSNGNIPHTSESPLARQGSFYSGYDGLPQAPTSNMGATSNSYDPFSLDSGMQNGPMYTSSPMGNMGAMQMQYPNQMLGSAARSGATRTPNNFYGQQQGMGMNGMYGTPPGAGMQGMGMNPNMMNQGFHNGATGFGMGGQGMFPGYPVQYVPPMAHGSMGGQRGRRMG